MGKFSAWSLVLVASLLAVKVLAQEDVARGDDELDLADALAGEDDTELPAPTIKPKLPATEDALDLDLGLEDPVIPTEAPPRAAPLVTKAPVKPKPKPDDTQLEFFPTLRPGLLPRSTGAPGATRTPPRGQPAGDDLDLSDALDPNNDIGGKDKDKGQADKEAGGGGRGDGSPNTRGTGGGSFSDDDLTDVGKDDTYKPDKGKGGRGDGDQLDNTEDNQGTMAETGTIAGIVSAVAMALVGAVTSYISYQKKKFCFSIQQSLNAEPVKTENPDAVVATEPQVQQTLLEPPNAEPPSEENAV